MQYDQCESNFAFLVSPPVERNRSLEEQSQSDRESLAQQLQSTNESLVREKAELSEKLAALEAQTSNQAGDRAALEKELEEARGKLNETLSQRTPYR